MELAKIGLNMLTKTTTELLEALADSRNDEAWRRFDERYRPIVNSFVRHVGLNPDDAADVAQEALVRFVRSFRDGKYDRQRGRLSAWLIGIAKHCVDDLHANRRKRREARGLSALLSWPDDHRLTHIWDAACEQAILRNGFNLLREETQFDPRTIAVLEMLILEGHSPTEVAQSLGLSLNDVYVSKHRCLSRLRHLLNGLTEAYEAPIDNGS